MTNASELVIVGRVLQQHPFPADTIATLSLIEVHEVLKGSTPRAPLRLWTVGTPVYLEQHSDVDGSGDPPLFGRDYVMFLKRLPELADAEGNLVSVRDVWTATGLGHYVQIEDERFHWDGDSPDGRTGPPPRVKLPEIRRAVQDAE